MDNKNSYTGYNIKTQNFEGPLDLLLFLVRNYEINIYDIPISEITDQFLEYIGLMKKLDIEIASEFIVMAAHLMLIKSRMMLPVEEDLEAEDDPRGDLVQQLLEYQKFKEAASTLDSSFAVNSEVLERKADQILLDFPDDEDNWVEVKIFDLINAFSRLIGEEGKTKPTFSVFDDIEEDYDPEEKIRQIQSVLDIKGKVLFHELFSFEVRRGEIITVFLAILHMIKRLSIVVKQHKMFGDITLFPKSVTGDKL
ncbi:MAG: segregation/condensation protein A [Spirochaetes bacterium]|nr:segregation/condensation protein A [Spirochaetota bacterium]